MFQRSAVSRGYGSGKFGDCRLPYISDRESSWASTREVKKKKEKKEEEKKEEGKKEEGKKEEAKESGATDRLEEKTEDSGHLVVELFAVVR